MNKVFVISDTHFPFHAQEAYTKMLQHISLEQPTHVIQVGDLTDQYVFSRFSKSNSINVQNDLIAGLNMAAAMWRDIQSIVPKAECIQLLGNHCNRIQKKILDKLPELETLLTIEHLYKFEGVDVLKSERDYVEIDGVIYCHGWLSKSLEHAKFFNKPTVHGHRHRPCIEFANPNLWSMDVGFLADRNSLPMSYTFSKFSQWTLACGVVENNKPRLIILE